MSKPSTPVWGRFWRRVDAEGDCWVWTGGKTSPGYGDVWIDSKTPHIPAHRLAWEMLVGPIPDGLVIDHLCRNRACVNPDHLEPVTLRENVRRGFAPNHIKRRLGKPSTHCYRGHLRDPDYNPEDCRECRKIRNAKITERRRAEARRAREVAS